MPERRASRRWLAVGLAGAALNVGYAFYRLPGLGEDVRVSATPLDRSGIHDSAPDYALLTAAAEVVPAGARVAIRTAWGDRARDAVLFRFAVALLPGRWVVAADARDGDAEYVILRGEGGLVDAQRLRVVESGSIWRRTPR
jgi:hypothetical protein